MMGLGEMMTDDDLFGMLNTADIDCDGKVTFEGKCCFFPDVLEESSITFNGKYVYRTLYVSFIEILFHSLHCFLRQSHK